jgi:NADPH:quinone reductase-like Zn-dependent oxidoreductase
MALFEIPKTQKAQVLEKAGAQLQYKEIPVPMPGPDEVLINIKVRKASAIFVLLFQYRSPIGLDLA